MTTVVYILDLSDVVAKLKKIILKHWILDFLFRFSEFLNHVLIIYELIEFKFNKRFKNIILLRGLILTNKVKYDNEKIHKVALLYVNR